MNDACGSKWIYAAVLLSALIVQSNIIFPGEDEFYIIADIGNIEQEKRSLYGKTVR